MPIRLVDDIRPQMISHMYWKKKVTFQLNVDIYEHWVAFAVEDGSFSFEINGKKGESAFGDLVFCPPGVAFHREIIRPLSFHFILLDWVDAFGMSANSQLLNAIPSGSISIKNIDRLSSNYLHLKKWAEVTGAASLKMKNHLLTDLWYLYCEEIDTSLKPAIDSPTAHVKIKEAVQFIQTNALSSINIKKIAQDLRLSQVQFTRLFKKNTGMLPHDYLTSLRLQKVQMLLLESDLTLHRIAELCGYENEFYLSRVFTKKKKITPSQFRKLHRI